MGPVFAVVLKVLSAEKYPVMAGSGSAAFMVSIWLILILGLSGPFTFWWILLSLIMALFLAASGFVGGVYSIIRWNRRGNALFGTVVSLFSLLFSLWLWSIFLQYGDRI